MRKGLATPGSFCALMAFSSWSPRTSSATTLPLSPSTINSFSVCEAGTPKKAARSAMVRWPGVATSASAADGAARGVAGGSAGASSRFAA